MTSPLVLIAASARLTRLITTDDLGQWWVQDPIDRAAQRWYDRQVIRAREARGLVTIDWDDEDEEVPQPWWWKYRSGLDCPFCIGFWIALGLIAADRRLSGRGLWSLGVQALALNYVAAHAESLLTSITEEMADER